MDQQYPGVLHVGFNLDDEVLPAEFVNSPLNLPGIKPRPGECPGALHLIGNTEDNDSARGIGKTDCRLGQNFFGIGF